ncbi:putative flavoprotein involved in K+ transport [Motilibacter rhizosphaerae]|uniref:Putative flavoprotein involved in K+ transport n=1 Tax=Motilibacter rhizosphaerae TaxID=598652 RepID=A0A4Q7NUP6_9ACTN|nr:MSMEG_0569 family flavin-dependent oxidoreductase [Motilibacter rhizosphaerae]RZS90845.1 putative flavoprotein involved in K+ transport [Motilibacter rhizosphaerae]
MSHEPLNGLPASVPVLVVGAGQAGLSMSWVLEHEGIEHLVLERDTIGHEWQDGRWDSFCLVTPNWQCQLPGFPYAGPDPDGFMVRSEILDYIKAYAASFDPPVVEHTTVESLEPLPDGGFSVTTSRGSLTCEQVVVATGGYHRPALPRLSASLPERLRQLHSSVYKRPSDLPEGDVLVVGTGQSGAQIAEDLHLAGRRVHLAVGSAPRVARTYRGRDVVAWLHDMGHYDIPVSEHPLGEEVRRRTNHYVTGRDGGRDIDLRAFALQGMALHGRLVELDGDVLRFDDTLAANLDAADAVSEGIKDAVDRWIAEQGIAAPTEARYVPVWQPQPGPSSVPLGELGGVVWATGFRRDDGWLRVPVFDGAGRLVHHRGVTPVEGVHVLGLPWLHTWGSGRFSGVARDAEHLGAHIAARVSGRALAAATR